MVLAFYLRVGSDLYMKSYFLDVLIYAVPLSAVIAAVTFRVFGMYRGLWRYASLPDLLTILKASFVSIAVFVITLFIVTRLHNFPRSVPIIQWVLMVSMLTGPRLLYRIWRDRRTESIKKQGYDGMAIPVLLFGADDGAELFIRAAASTHNHNYAVIGIIDEKSKRGGRSMMGVPIYDYTDQDLSIVLAVVEKKHKCRPQKIIFTKSTRDLEKEIVQSLDKQAEANSIILARLPKLTDFKKAADEGDIQVQSFDIEDLLGRSQVPIDRGAIAEFISGKRILVTGAGGTIGGELSRQLARLKPASLILLDQGEYNLYQIDREIEPLMRGETVDGKAQHYKSLLCDIRDHDRVNRIFAAEKPEVIFHAAALKHVPIVELNPEEGILTNLIGTRNVADAANDVGALALVQVSTDKAVNPTNIMGASKRLGELYAQSLDVTSDTTRFVTVRFGNVLGSSGSVVPLFQKQLAEGGPLTVTHPDIKRYFMTVREASGLILQAVTKTFELNLDKGNIFVLDMGESILIADVARKIIRLGGFKPGQDVDIVYTGLRPGEKLYEELFDSEETPLPTKIKGINAARPQIVERALLNKNFEDIEKSARTGDVKAIKQKLSTIVRGYSPQTGNTQTENTTTQETDNNDQSQNDIK